MSQRVTITFAVLIGTALLVSCAEEEQAAEPVASAPTEQLAAEVDETYSETVQAEPNEPAEQTTPEKSEPNDDNASAVLASSQEESGNELVIDQELCGVPEGGLDLPTPEARLVTISGYQEDESIVLANTLSNSGTFRVTVELDDSGIAVGVPFDMHITFEMSDGSAVPGGVLMDADAYMPQHFHGMNVTPREVPTGRGAYDIEGMVFHMVGRWEVYLDLTRRGVTERAQFVFEVE